MELEDLIQEGYATYAFCRRKYSHVTERPHFMALFKTCYSNQVTDLAAKMWKIGSEISADAMLENERDGGVSPDSLMPHTLPDAMLMTLLSEAKFPLRSLLELFATDSGIKLMAQLPQRSRESANHYFCRIMGISHKEYNLPEMMRDFLAGRGMSNKLVRVHQLQIA